MKRIVLRGVVTLCAAIIATGICLTLGADDDYEHQRRAAEQRHRELQREADQLLRELERGDLREGEQEALLEQREPFSGPYRDGRYDDADFGSSPRDGSNWDARRESEVRRLEQRLDQAEHLRRISERNGNPRLANAADRMEERALADYERRLAQIDQHQVPIQATPGMYAGPAPTPASPYGQAPSTPTMEPPGSGLSEFNDAYQQWLFNEQQVLRQRLDAAYRMRQMGEYYRDQRLIDEAARIEEAALLSFDGRMQHVRAPLTPVQQVQLDQFLEQSIAGAVEYELDRRVLQPIHETVIRPIDDFERAVLDQPVRRLIEDVSDWISR